MDSKQRLDVLYANCFQDQAEGHFLYRPPSSTWLRPGVCGFFDNQGDWQALADLTNPEDLAKKGYSFVPGIEVEVSVTRGEEWRPRMSQNVRRIDLKEDEIPGRPAGGGSMARFTSSSGPGAILITDGDVKQAWARPVQGLAQWLRENSRAVVKKNPGARRQRLELVVYSYSVKRLALAVINSKDEAKTVDVVLGTKSFQPTAAWWQTNTATESTWKIHHDENGLVYAMGGIDWVPARDHSNEEESEGDGDNEEGIVEESEDDGDDEEDIELSDSGSSNALDEEDRSESASRPRTKIAQSQNKSIRYSRSKRRELRGPGRVATMFAQRRNLGRKLDECRESVQGNSPAADLHRWPAGRTWPPGSAPWMPLRLPLDSGRAATDVDRSLEYLMEYSDWLLRNWSKFHAISGEDVSATALVYQFYRNVVSVVKVSEKQSLSLSDLISRARATLAKNEDLADCWRIYKNSPLLNPEKEVQSGSELVSIIEPWNGKSEDLIRYLQMMLQTIDLAMVSHLNAHRSAASRESSGNLIRIPTAFDDTMNSEHILLFKPYRLACLDGLARGRKVWVFHRQSDMPREPLYLSARADHFAMIWGPLWTVPADGMDGLIDHYNVGGGHLYPIESSHGPQLLPNERRCHWRKREAPHDEQEDASSLSGEDSEPDRSTPVHLQQMRQAEPLKDNSIMLIGATDSPKMKWYACHCSMSDLKSRMRGSQKLHPLSSRGWFNYVSSTSVGVSLSHSGVGVSGTASIQTDEGQTLKQGLLEEWENHPRSWDPRDLMDFRGVLVSACTFNARRVRLVELLSTDTMLAVIDRCKFDDENTRERLIRALEDGDPFATVYLWENNSHMRDDLGNAFLACLRALCKSGYDSRHNVFNVLWKPPHERKVHRLELQPNDHRWLSLLKDTEDSMTVAVLVEDRLATQSKRLCGRGNNTLTTLETAITINRSLSPATCLKKVKERKYRDHSPWRTADRCWKYVWKVRNVPAGASFRLAEANSLKTHSVLTDTHLLVAQTSVLSQLLKDRLKIKSSRKQRHWEYASDNSDDDSAGDDIRPVPVQVY
ncbi:hypothetical protein CLAIMM_01261 [Cladophialophora immunda]|nr:hypothetical protein CLAIMM_01261 [Cladophialophora immunda]